MTDGRLTGFISGVGAAAADAVFGVIAALSVSAVTRILTEHHTVFRMAGGVFLIGIGVTTFRSRPPVDSIRPTRAAGLWMAFGSTMILTLMNPMTIVSFMGVFATLGITAKEGGPTAGAQLVLGVFLGSASWFFCLSTAASSLGERMSKGGLRTLNVVCGTLFVAFGLWQLLSLGHG